MSWLFVALVVILVIDIFVFLADKYILSFFIFFGSIVGYNYLQGDAGLLDTVKTLVFDYGLLYLGAGVATAAAKWLIFNLKLGRKLSELSEKFNRSNLPKTYHDFLRWINGSYGGGISKILNQDEHISSDDIDAVRTKDDMDTLLTPRAAKQKSRITFWVLQWPIVLLTMLVEDFLIKIGHRVAELLDYLMSRFSKMLVANATNKLNIKQ